MDIVYDHDIVYDYRKADDHRKYAEECLTMALSSAEDDDKALWLTLAQSWARLAEQVAYVENNPWRRRKGLRMKLVEACGGPSWPDEECRSCILAFLITTEPCLANPFPSTHCINCPANGWIITGPSRPSVPQGKTAEASHREFQNW